MNRENNSELTNLLTTLLNVVNEAKNNKPLTTSLNSLLTENKVFQTLLTTWAERSLASHLTPKNTHLLNDLLNNKDLRKEQLRFMYRGSGKNCPCVICSTATTKKWIKQGEQCFYFKETSFNFHVDCANSDDLTHPDYVLYYKPKTSPLNLIPCTDPLPQIDDNNDNNE